MGVSGGLPSHAFQYIMAQGGLDTEESYAYEAADGVCRFKKEDVDASLRDEVNIAAGSETELTHASPTHGTNPCYTSTAILRLPLLIIFRLILLLPLEYYC